MSFLQKIHPKQTDNTETAAISASHAHALQHGVQNYANNIANHPANILSAYHLCPEDSDLMETLEAIGKKYHIPIMAATYKEYYGRYLRRQPKGDAAKMFAHVYAMEKAFLHLWYLYKSVFAEYVLQLQKNAGGSIKSDTVYTDAHYTALIACNKVLKQSL